MPVGGRSFAEALRMGAEVFHRLKQTLTSSGLATAVGDEGGFAPDLGSNGRRSRCSMEAIEAAGYVPGEEVAIALDPAVSELHRRQVTCSSTRAARSAPTSWPDTGRTWPAVPDRLDRGRHGRGGLGRWKTLTERIGDRVQLVGDDLFVTNAERLRRGIDTGMHMLYLASDPPDLLAQASLGVIDDLNIRPEIVPASALRCGQIARRTHPSAEPVGRRPQGQLGIDVQLARHVDDREQQIAHLLEALFGRLSALQLGQLLAHGLQRTLDPGEVEARRRRRGAAPCARTAATAGSRGPRRRSPARGQARAA